MLYVSRDWKDGTYDVTDTSDGVVERVSQLEINGYIRQGVTIEGVSRSGKVTSIIKDIKTLIARTHLRERLSGLPLTRSFNFGRYSVGLPDGYRSLMNESNEFVYGLFNVEICEEFTIPDFIEEICQNCFCSTRLKHIDIPANVKAIGEYAFSGVTTLESVRFNGNIKIGDSVFRGCKRLSNLEGMENVVSLGSSALNATAIKKFESSPNLATVYDSCFYGTPLVEASFKHPVAFYGGATFMYCNQLRKADISGTTELILGETFYGCSKLEDVVLPDGLETLGASSFSLCSSLRKIEIPSTVTLIGAKAFIKCAVLEEIRLPEAVEYIYDSAFEDCTSLTKVDLGGVVSIDVCSFQGCSNLSDIDLSGVKVFKFGAFSACTSLEEVHLDSAERIGDRAFNDCLSLRVVHMPTEKLTLVDKDAFCGCDNLEAVYVTKGSTEDLYCRAIGLPVVYR